MTGSREVLSENAELLPELHHVLRVMSELCPARARLAAEMLARLCRPWLAQIKSGRPLYTSLLTPGGYPLEFAFNANSSDISYTAEPGVPHSSVEAKWQFVRDIVGDFDPDQHALLRELAVQPSQRFGVWLSVRHQHNGSAGEIRTLKVYQEVGARGRDLVLRHLRRHVDGLNGVIELEPTLLGVVPTAGGTTETYAKINSPNPGVLHKLFAAAGVAKQLPCALDYLAYLAARQRSRLWDGLCIGLSYSISTAGPPLLTLFANASELFRTDRDARRRLLGFARQLGSQMSVYERITSSFEEAEPTHMLHGLVGIKLAASGRLEFTAGLRPFT